VLYDPDHDERNAQQDRGQDQRRAMSLRESARRFGRRIQVISI
jgi:hypothetical protein